MCKKIVMISLALASVVLLNCPMIHAQEPTPTPAATALPAPDEPAKLNINIASLKELQTLPGVDAALAEAIVKNRPYQTVEELGKVAAVTKETFAVIQPMIAAQKLNVNSATLKELKLVPGIKPDIAAAMIAGRPYQTFEELLKVKGIREQDLAALNNWLEAKPAEKAKKERGWDQSKQKKRSVPITKPEQKPVPPQKTP